MCQHWARREGGFTVVELVTSIVLLAIISASVSSRWFGAEAYEINSASTQLLSVARLAQKLSLAKRGVSIHMKVSQIPGGWRYQIIEDDAGIIETLHQFELDAEVLGFKVKAGIGPISLAGVDALDLEYDALGNIIAVSIGAGIGVADEGVRFELANLRLAAAPLRLICISPLGFAHDGACV